MKKMSISLFILFFIANCVTLFAVENPNNKIKKLEEEVKRVSGKEKIEILNELSSVYLDKSPEKSIKYGKEALILSQKFNDMKLEISVLKNISKAYGALGKKEKSLEYYSKALKLIETSIMRSLIDDYLSLSQYYTQIGNKENAEKYYKLYTQINDSLLSLKMAEKLEVEKKKVEISEKNQAIQKLTQKQKEYEADLQKRELENKMNERKIENLKKNSELQESELEQKKYAMELKEKKIDNLKKDREIQNLKLKQVKYEMEMKKKEIGFLKQIKEIRELKLAKQRNLIKTLVAIFILVLLSILIMYNRYHIVSRINKALEESDEEMNKMNNKLKKAHKELDLLAKTDPLTGLSNRRDMWEKLNYEKIRFERSKRPFVLAMCDIDDFKSINDKFGHDAGDIVLKSIAKLMKSIVRKQDIIARWGGEEFLLLFPEINIEGGRVVTEKIREKIEATPSTFNSNELPVTITIGVSIFNKLMDIDACITKADQALYEGKKLGKNRVVLANQD